MYVTVAKLYWLLTVSPSRCSACCDIYHSVPNLSICYHSGVSPLGDDELPLPLPIARKVDPSTGLPQVITRTITVRDGVQINYYLIGSGHKNLVFAQGK